MKYKLLSLIIGAIALLVTPTVAHSQTVCAPREQVERQLGSQYGEQEVAIGITFNNKLLSIFINKQSRSFTITVTSPKESKATCIIATGSNFEIDNNRILARFK